MKSKNWIVRYVIVTSYPISGTWIIIASTEKEAIERVFDKIMHLYGLHPSEISYGQYEAEVTS